jgi:YidC/Oxa1 family membrane protein insertase
MSQAPRPQSNFLQTMLLVSMVFMGYLLITNAFRPVDDTRTTAQVRAELERLNAERMDVSIARLFETYRRKVEADAAAGRISSQQALALKLQGATLVADTQFKAGYMRGELARFNAAYVLLNRWYRRHGNDPVWTQEVRVAAEREHPRTVVTPAQVYEEVQREMSERYKDDLILGVVPGWRIIDFLVGLTGHVPGFSYAFAAFILALLVRAIIWPLAQNQLMWGRKMMQLQPLVKEIREKYQKKGGARMTPQEQQKLQVETMGLYRTYGINPVAGCLPALVQFPFFILVYYCMVHYRFEFKNGTFLWINPATSEAMGRWFAPSLGDMDVPLLIIYGISMIITTLLAPVSDPANARLYRGLGIFLAIFFTITMFFWPFPSAFVLYWIFLNVFATIQSLRAYRLPLPPLVKVNAPHGAAIPVDPTMNGTMFGKTGTPKAHKPKPKRKK